MKNLLIQNLVNFLSDLYAIAKAPVLHFLYLLLGLTTAVVCVSWPTTNFGYVDIYSHLIISDQDGPSSFFALSCFLDLELKSKCNDQGHSKQGYYH